MVTKSCYENVLDDLKRRRDALNEIIAVIQRFTDIYIEEERLDETGKVRVSEKEHAAQADNGQRNPYQAYLRKVKKLPVREALPMIFAKHNGRSMKLADILDEMRKAGRKEVTEAAVRQSLMRIGSRHPMGQRTLWNPPPG